MIKVKKSPIHGKGLFSTKSITKGTVLGKCQVTKAQEPNDYTLWVGNKMLDVICNFKFINHSMSPNVIYYDDLSVVALRNISEGEELTHQYE